MRDNNIVGHEVKPSMMCTHLLEASSCSMAHAYTKATPPGRIIRHSSDKALKRRAYRIKRAYAGNKVVGRHTLGGITCNWRTSSEQLSVASCI